MALFCKPLVDVAPAFKVQVGLNMLLNCHLSMFLNQWLMISIDLPSCVLMFVKPRFVCTRSWLDVTTAYVWWKTAGTKCIGYYMLVQYIPNIQILTLWHVYTYLLVTWPQIWETMRYFEYWVSSILRQDGTKTCNVHNANRITIEDSDSYGSPCTNVPAVSAKWLSMNQNISLQRRVRSHS